MPNAEKTEKVAALKERIGGSTALLLAEYRGLSVHEATELRRSLADQARFAVVKNTLMQRAAAEAGIEDLEALLAGPTAVAFVEGDVVTAAKQVVDASKRFPALVLKGAYLDGRVLSAAEAQSLATLDTREVMLSKIAGLLKMEMNRAASMFQAVQSRFLGVLEAYKEKVPGDAATEAPAASEPTDASVLSVEGDIGKDIEASAEDAAAAETDGAKAETAPTEQPDAEAATAVDGDDGEPAEESAEAPEAGSASETNDETPTETSTDGTEEA